MNYAHFIKRSLPIGLLIILCSISWSAGVLAQPKDTKKNNKNKKNIFKGCICEIDKEKSRIFIVHRNSETKKWEPDAGQWFTYDGSTKVEGYEQVVTISHLNSGQPLKMARMTGFSASGFTGEVFEIKNLEELIGQRATIHFQKNKQGTSTGLIELEDLFAGESLPAIGGGSSAQIVGSGRCPCKTR
jgi:hypothetical protein